jgi:hypothetical protein
MKKSLESLAHFPSLQSISKVAKNKFVPYGTGLGILAFTLFGCGGSKGSTVPTSETNNPPVMGNISDKTIQSRETFAPIDLKKNTSDESLETVTYQAQGNTNLGINIENGYLQVSVPENWTGAETVTVIATDDKGQSGANSRDDITFTVHETNGGNTAPYVTFSDLPTEVNKNSSSAGQIKAVDPNNDEMSCYFVNPSDAFVTSKGSTHPINGEFTCDIEIAPRNNNVGHHQKIIRIDDGQGYVDTPMNFEVINTEGVAFKTTDDAGQNVDGIKVRMHNATNSYECTTASGSCTIQNVSNKTYNLTYTDIYNQFQTSKTGNIIVSYENAQNGGLDLERILYLQANQENVNNIVRGTGVPGEQSSYGNEKWETYRSKFIIFTDEFSTGQPVDPLIINGLIDTIINKWSVCYNQDFSIEDIEKIHEAPPIGLDLKNGNVGIYFNNTQSASALTTVYSNGGDIVEAYISFKTNAGKSAEIQDGCEAAINGAETDQFPSSIFYDNGSGTTATTFSDEDLRNFKLIYARPIGNKDLSKELGPEYGDVDPSYNLDWDN